MEAHIILTHQQILSSVKRLAYEIYEKNFDCDSIILAGIKNRGWMLAQRLELELKAIAVGKKISLQAININKETPTDGAYSVEEIEKTGSEVVIIVDDVLYTGTTLIYSMLPYLKQKVNKLQILVLVHRDYLKFPVKPDFVGTSLATTMQEHVKVQIENAPYEVLLE